MKKLFLLLIIILNNSGFACDCPQLTVKEAYGNAQDVFIGEVIAVDNSYYGKSGRQMTTLYKIRAKKPFKSGIGKGNEIVTFYTTVGNCEYDFIKGETYLIYTDASDITFTHTNICLRTELLKNVKKAELDELEILYENVNKKGNLDIFFPEMITISQKEYKVLQKQSLNAQNFENQNRYLSILCSFIFIASIVFLILYLKTKKKLNRT